MSEYLTGAQAPLLVGIVLALAALAVVLAPVLGAEEPRIRARRTSDALHPDDVVEASAIDALREIEFDRATEKLSDSDYDTLKRQYTAAALAELRAREGGATAAPAPPVADLAERLVGKYKPADRSCVTCGPRPEPDALYCSTCGVYLPGSCDSCGASVTMPGAHFCTACGHALAA
ncbi:MAG: zinc ribbon domain-containing protein [Gemmatimonadaceae bacterium]|jgi:hypothetical protein|nr:zinc ribbon domain-containing protein [Gemmatimonadaceae bacterium]